MRPSSVRLLNILVSIKRAVDFAVKIRVNPQQTGIDLNVKHSMARNPFDEIAVEEAVRLRERLKTDVKSIKVVTIGPPKSIETLRTALAMGADSAIHVEITESAPAPEPLGVAKALQVIIKRKHENGGGVGLVILGMQAIDNDAGHWQTGQMLAGLMGWPQATFASKLAVDLHNKVADVTRRSMAEWKSCAVGCLWSSLPICEPRYASLPNIMKAAKKKPTA